MNLATILKRPLQKWFQNPNIEFIYALCTGCRTYMGICPKGVFDFDEREKRIFAGRPEACFTCGACGYQCPEHALKIA